MTVFSFLQFSSWLKKTDEKVQAPLYQYSEADSSLVRFRVLSSFLSISPQTTPVIQYLSRNLLMDNEAPKR